MIELTDEMRHAYETAARDSSGWLAVRSFDAGLRAVLALVERDHIVLERDAEALCPAVTETQGALVRCGKKAENHDAHLGRHDGWDVIW